MLWFTLDINSLIPGAQAWLYGPQLDELVEFLPAGPVHGVTQAADMQQD
jgi:hypothetical protein